MNIKKYISVIVLLFTFFTSSSQKVDSLQLLQDVNGGNVEFVAIAANAVNWGHGYGTKNVNFITSLRNYTISILPITLSSFKPTIEANTIKLDWTTISESNSNYFDSLKSTDGKTFST